MSLMVVAAMAGAYVATAPAASAEDGVATAPTDGVVVFYFHGNVRCATCKKIEAYADEAIRENFADGLQDGALTWKVANVEEPENRHYVQDFQLVTRSVVLAEFADGKVVRWKNLDKVWQLIRNQDSFSAYIVDETSAFLGES
jgi:hypothetical protein